MSRFACFRSTLRSTSFWRNVDMGPPDAIFGITEAFKKDTNPKKINLGAGSYRGDDGKPYLLQAVRLAEKNVIEAATEKEYLPVSGNPEFCSLAAEIALKKDCPFIKEGRIATVQCLSGTGGLTLASAFLARFAQYHDIWMPTPTWANHPQIFANSGLTSHTFPYYDANTCGFNSSGCLDTLNRLPKGHSVLLHACAHNPTGVDPSKEEWMKIGEIIKSRELLPFFDFAYQGFASGDIDRDAWSVRHFANELRIPNMVVVQSFAKNMGLYGERVGALSFLCERPEEAERCMSQLKRLIRASYSNPPLHGARIAAEVMSNPELKKLWLTEVKGMADRIIDMRQRLVQGLAREGSKRDWSHITNQIGMFCYTGFTPEQVEKITRNYSVFLTKDGRISVASISSANVEYLAHAMHQVSK